MEPVRRTTITTQKSLTLGLVGFTKTSAVEGVSLSAKSRRMFAEFEAKGLTAQQRRQAIAAKHTKKA